MDVKEEGKQPSQVTESPYLTIAEAAKMLRVGEDTVERLIASGQLPASEISSKGIAAGKKFKRISIDDVHAFMKRSKPVDLVEPRKRRSIKPDQSVKDYFPDR